MDRDEHHQFAEAASSLNWYEVAKLMHENSLVLHNAPQGRVGYLREGKWVMRRTSNRAVFLLAAFAMENLLKAYLIYENPQYIEGGRLSKKLMNGHNLSRLQQECKKIPQPVRTRFIFEALGVGVNSWARYPCSTSAEKESLERAITPEFWAEYNRVFELYSRRLEALLSKRHKGAYGVPMTVRFEKNS
jgi:hypothetical protein